MVSKGQNPLWWQEAVVYQIYPRSFFDSNHDGIGDLNGIIQKLDFLNDGTEKSLGIDAIWISPIYPSPMFDFGYDISDYRGIDSVFGNINDFKALLQEAHKRQIRVIIDLVINHTSHLHPWFIESSSSIDSPKRDWYIWEKGVKGKLPNNWLGAFGGSAWEWDEKTEEYYFHSFLKEQPDLNYRNPDVVYAILDMMKYWLDIGVDGFRLDAINFIIKDKKLRNNPSQFFRGFRPYDRQLHIYDRDRPELQEIYKKIRSLLDSYSSRMCVGEIIMYPPGHAPLPAMYYGENNDQLHMAFNFSCLFTSWSHEKFRYIVQEWENALGENKWPNYTLSNHDFQRHFSRFGNSLEKGRLATLMLMTLRGTPFLYYGDEIGMKSEYVPLRQIQDPVGKEYWPLYSGRDQLRRPMCWDSTKYAGFSTVKSWLPVNSDYKKNNVASQNNDPDSLLNFYRRLIWFRKSSDVLKKGKIIIHEKEFPGLFVYYREYRKQKYLIILNFEKKKGLFNDIILKGEVLFSTHGKEGHVIGMNQIELEKFEGMVVDLG